MKSLYKNIGKIGKYIIGIISKSSYVIFVCIIIWIIIIQIT